VRTLQLPNTYLQEDTRTAQIRQVIGHSESVGPSDTFLNRNTMDDCLLALCLTIIIFIILTMYQWWQWSRAVPAANSPIENEHATIEIVNGVLGEDICCICCGEFNDPLGYMSCKTCKKQVHVHCGATWFVYERIAGRERSCPFCRQLW